jgi:T5SS/PEP-CTERM-associated repeat protein
MVAGNAFAQAVVGTIYRYQFDSNSSQSGEATDASADLDLSGTLNAASITLTPQDDTTSGQTTGSYIGNINAAQSGNGYGGSIEITLTADAPDGIVTSSSSTGVFSVEFEVQGAPAQVRFSGTAEVTASGVGFGLASIRILGDADVTVVEVPIDAPTLLSIDESVNLPPGTYTALFFTNAVAQIFAKKQLGPNMAMTTLNVDFSIAQFDQLFWIANDGNFNDAANWQPAQVPGATQTVVFDRDAVYTVTIPPTSTARAIIERGNVSFAGGPYNLTAPGPATPALVVGNSVAAATNNAVLFLDPGMQLVSENATIGLGAGTEGSVQNTLGGAWLIDGIFNVGDAGEGFLTIDNNSPLKAGVMFLGEAESGFGNVAIHGSSSDTNTPLVEVDGSLVVGFAGEAVLRIDDALVSSGNATIGSQPESDGLVEIEGTEGRASWVVGDKLAVGDGGKGVLNILSGRIEPGVPADPTVTELRISEENGSNGEVNVLGPNALITGFNCIDVGLFNGDGRMDIADGGHVLADNMNVGPITNTNTGDGFVNLQNGPLGGATKDQHESRIDIALLLSVGVGGDGAIFSNDGIITAESVDIGTARGGTGIFAIGVGGVLEVVEAIVIGEIGVPDDESGYGILSLDAGSEVSADEIYVRAESRIDGSGTILVETGLFVAAGGVVEANVDVQVAKFLDALTIDGDLFVDGGILEIVVGGLNPGQYGEIRVTGLADLLNPRIRFKFINGFLPQTGTLLPFLEVDGALNMTNPILEFEGVAPGFDFKINEENGKLTFQALSDARAIGDNPNHGFWGCHQSNQAGFTVYMGMLPLLAVPVAAVGFRGRRSRRRK